MQAKVYRTILRCSSARFFAVLPQKPCTFPRSIVILLGKNTVYNACILQKQLRKAVFADPHSKAVGTSRSSDLFSRHYITQDLLPIKIQRETGLILLFSHPDQNGMDVHDLSAGSIPICMFLPMKEQLHNTKINSVIPAATK